jgi:hypothetical protein
MQNDDNDKTGYIDMSEVDSVVSSIIHSFMNRARIGKEKYGKTLDRTDLKVTDWINHAQEELMDGILYLEKLKQSSGTILLNHIPSPPDTPPPPFPSPLHNNIMMDTNNIDSEYTISDYACNTHTHIPNNQQQQQQQQHHQEQPQPITKNKNIEYQISVLIGEQCNIEKKVVKNKSLFESNILFASLKENALQQGISALILYAVDTVTFESKELKSWFYDEIDINKEYNKDK